MPGRVEEQFRRLIPYGLNGPKAVGNSVFAENGFGIKAGSMV